MKHEKILLTTLFLCWTCSIFAQKFAKGDTIMPPPTSGVCYAKSVTPDKFKIIEEQVIIEAAKTTEEFVPAIYDTLQQRLLIRKAYEKIVTYEAEFDTIMVKVKVKDKSRVIEEKYKTVFNVKKKPNADGSEKNGEWVTVKIPNCNSPNPKDCETLQWVEKKQEYDISTKEVFVAATWADSSGESESILVPKVVQRRPARVERIFVPADYKVVEKAVLKKHARKILVEIPPKYKTVKKKKLVEKGGKQVWVEILCPSSLNEIVISQVQLALKGRKYYKGGISGLLDKETQAAIEKFQNENSLPIGKLDRDTIEALGFNYVIFKEPFSEDNN